MIPEVHASTGSRACFSWIAGLLLFSTAVAIAGPSADSASKPCVAVLEAEVIAKMPGDERKALAGWLDTLLTESLAKRKDFVTVDRQALDKVLAEKTAKAGGLTKIDPKDVAASLRPFWSAGVLICPVIRQANPKDSSGKMIVSVEAVLAQTGQLLAELHAQGVWKNGRWAKPPKISEGLDSFAAEICRNLNRNLNRPVVEVAAGRLTSKLTRLQWMVDELTDALSSCVGAEHGVVLLAPRHPLSTKEERLLRVMGLSAAKGNDKAAGLAPTSDIRLTTELVESVSGKVSFRKTPITVRLTLRAGDKVVVSKSLSGTVETSQKLRDEAKKWFAEQLGKSTKTSKPVNAEELARKLAAEEVTSLRRLMSFDYGDRDLEIHRLVRLVRRALRAAHLDPTCEAAAYLVAMHVGNLYSVRGQDETMACKDRILAESGKYLDRFGGKVASHHRQVLDQVISTTYRASWKIRGRGQSYTAILDPPNARLYPYVREGVRALADRGYLAETDKRYANTNAFSQMGHWLRRDLIPTIPEEYLDEEYEYWRGFWKNKVEKVPPRKAKPWQSRDPDPWDLIEAAFRARRRDAKGLRVTLQRLADRFPKSKTRVWRLAREEIIPLYLRASGDAEWRTWKPTFADKTIEIPRHEWQAYYNRFRPRLPTAWEYDKLPTLKATRLLFPKKVLDLSLPRGYLNMTIPQIGPLCQAGGDVWFITPTRWDTSNLKVPQYLHVLSEKEAFAADRGDLTVTPRRLHWPKHPRLDLSVKVNGRMNQLTITWVCVTGSGLKQTVWIGTKWHGVARFDKKNREWTGRWYTTRDGMPSENVHWIRPYHGGEGTTMLLISGPSKNKRQSSEVELWTLDPGKHAIKVIEHDKTKKRRYNWPVMAVWPDNKRVLLLSPDLADAGNLDFEKVDRFESLALRDDLYTTQDPADSTLRRRWRFDDDNLWEVTKVSLATSKARCRLVARAPLWFNTGEFSKGAPCPYRIFTPDSPLELSRTRTARSTVATLKEARATVAAWKDTLWMSCNEKNAFDTRKRDGLLIFRPSALGDKTTANQWIGPFLTPDHERIVDLWSDQAGHVWITTGSNLYWVNAKRLLSSKLAISQTRTKKQWQSEYWKRLDKLSWQCRVGASVMSRQWTEALRILDTEQKSLGTVTAASNAAKKGSHADLLMWRAFITSNKPDGAKQAIKLYEQIEADPLVDRSARQNARKFVILLRSKKGA